MRTAKRHLCALVAMVALVGVTSLVPAGAAPPTKNDTATTALVVRRLPYSKTVNMTNATDYSGPIEAVGGCYFSNMPQDVWFTYTPTANQSLTADTVGSFLRGSTDMYDTVLAAYTYDGTTFTKVACNDDISASDLASRITVEAAAGTTYYFRAGSYNGFYGTPTGVRMLQFNLAVSPTA